MRYTTNAPEREVERLAPEAYNVDHDRGMTTFVVRDRDATVVMSELKRADWVVYAGHPRVSYSSPRAFASASSHLRIR